MDALGQLGRILRVRPFPCLKDRPSLPFYGLIYLSLSWQYLCLNALKLSQFTKETPMNKLSPLVFLTSLLLGITLLPLPPKGHAMEEETSLLSLSPSWGEIQNVFHECFEKESPFAINPVALTHHLQEIVGGGAPSRPLLPGKEEKIPHFSKKESSPNPLLLDIKYGKSGEREGTKGISVDLIRRAAQKKNPYAQLLLGLRVLQGEGAKQDEGEAFALFKLAALLSSSSPPPEACILVGKMYEMGVGIGENKEEAWAWYGKALDFEEAFPHIFKVGNG
jgi:hypothetical protein